MAFPLLWPGQFPYLFTGLLSLQLRRGVDRFEVSCFSFEIPNWFFRHAIVSYRFYFAASLSDEQVDWVGTCQYLNPCQCIILNFFLDTSIYSNILHCLVASTTISMDRNWILSVKVRSFIPILSSHNTLCNGHIRNAGAGGDRTNAA